MSEHTPGSSRRIRWVGHRTHSAHDGRPLQLRHGLLLAAAHVRTHQTVLGAARHSGSVWKAEVVAMLSGQAHPSLRFLDGYRLNLTKLRQVAETGIAAELERRVEAKGWTELAELREAFEELRAISLDPGERLAQVEMLGEWQVQANLAAYLHSTDAGRVALAQAVMDLADVSLGSPALASAIIGYVRAQTGARGNVVYETEEYALAVERVERCLVHDWTPPAER